MYCQPALYSFGIRLDIIHAYALIQFLILLSLEVRGADPNCLELVLSEIDYKKIIVLHCNDDLVFTSHCYTRQYFFRLRL